MKTGRGSFHFAYGVLSHGQLSRTLAQAPVIEQGSNKMTGFHQVGTTASGQGEAT